MLAIKLQRVGRKHQPSYRLVVAESRSKMAAPPVEDLGSYNPFTKAITLKKERAEHWMKMGAQPTVTAHNLLVKQGVLTAPKIHVKMPKAIAKVAEPEPLPASEPTIVDPETSPEEPIVATPEQPQPETENAA